ncbi:MAG: right-handed parallel beta-helix repeat-containing protein [Chthoniobacterales bacterium]
MIPRPSIGVQILALAGLAAPLPAASFYVVPNGSNSNPGTAAAPWKTIQHAADRLQPGDTVFVRAGIYPGPVTVNVSGSAAGGPVTFSNFAGETPIIDGKGFAPPAANTALFLIENQSHVVIKGFKLRNYSSVRRDRVPAGIFVIGRSHHVELRDNNISRIKNTHARGNAFGIAIYGTSAERAITNLVIDGNEVHHLQTGNSESVAINGNVKNFAVTNNRVHDNNNIGIDFIGFEGTCPVAALDQARDGVCRGNVVWNISSRDNPAYGGVLAAGGIYCDGAARILIERNISHHNDLGVELASEHGGKQTSEITLRDNLIHQNRITGLALGGYDAMRGETINCSISNNTFYRNDTRESGSGEILLQFYVKENRFTQNIVCAGRQNLLVGNPALSNSGNLFDYNLYFAPAGPGQSQWQWRKKYKRGFANWKMATGQDAHSIFAAPKFQDPATADFHLQPSSPAIDAGDPAFSPSPGELDIDAASRLTGSRVDIGADEVAP